MKTATDIRNSLVTSVKDLLALRGWEVFQESKLGNDLFINDPDRANRIHEAAEYGCDGSTRAEVIEDWQEFADEHYSELEREAWGLDISEEESVALENDIEAARKALDADIADCERWHADNGTLHKQIG